MLNKYIITQSDKQPHHFEMQFNPPALHCMFVGTPQIKNIYCILNFEHCNIYMKIVLVQYKASFEPQISKRTTYLYFIAKNNNLLIEY